MAIPLKNGADLYNFEVLRMRFHNLGADPTSDFGVGQVYFNTSTSEGSGKRVRIYDGSAFRSLAYFDEIDNRLKLLEGEIDTDAIINNMKEVSAFLAGFAEDASLMNVLNGKLDKTGGTIEGGTEASPLFINTTANTSRIGFKKNSTTVGYLGFSDTNTPVFVNVNGGASNLLHSGNVGEYKAGDSDKLGGRSPSYYVGQHRDVSQVLDANTIAQNHITHGSKWSNTEMSTIHSLMDITYSADFRSQLLFRPNQQKIFSRFFYDGTTWSAWKTLAFTDSNVAGATYLVDANGKGIVKANGGGISILDQASTPTFRSVVEYKANNLHFGYDNMTSAVGYDTYLNGKNVYLRYSGGNTGLILNSSGNVTIGSSDLAGEDSKTPKLYIDGSTRLKGSLYFPDNSYISYTNIYLPSNDGSNSMSIFGNGDSRVNVATFYSNGKTLLGRSGNVLIGHATDGGAKLSVMGTHRVYRSVSYNEYLDISVGDISVNYNAYDSDGYSCHHFKSNGTTLMSILGNTGNVGIGTTEPEEKLHVVGNLLVEGNIIATGEVSAGGAGEEGDTSTGTGGGDALIYSQEFTPTTTSITITHNLSATKGVIVQVWEKNGNYWDMVLVDVEEVDTNTVTLFFGKTETTVHKVVIMG